MPMLTPCLNTSTIRPAPLMTKIDAAAAAGFRAIELWNDDVTAFVREGGSLPAVVDRLAERELRVPSVIAVMGWIGCPPAERAKSRKEAVRRMEQAKALGSPSIVASPPMGRVDVEQAAADYRELLQIGRDLGIRPSMEFLGFVEQINSIPAAWEIVERAGDPEGTIVIDWFHMVRGQGSTLDDLRRIPAERISIVHLDDVPYNKPFAEMSDADRVYPGEGDIPIRDMNAVLREIGYQGPISLELFNASLWAQDPFAVARTGFEKSQPYFSV
jgi:sugar phosphate isomerase/epimerase